MFTSDALRGLFGLIVEDDPLYARTLQRSLRKRGFEFEVAASLDGALTVARSSRLDFAVIDLHLGLQSGLELIAPLRRMHPAVRMIILTGYGTFATAVAAIKCGADDYLLKPTTADVIVQALLTQGDAPRAPPPLRMTPLASLEWEHLQRALKATLGNVSAAARLLGMHRRSLQRKLSRQAPDESEPDDARE